MIKYQRQLEEAENKLREYKENWDEFLEGVYSSVVRTVVTKGEIANPTPYYFERIGGRKPKGKVISEPVVSDDCMKYHYDKDNRIVLIEQYSKFLNQFRIKEVYVYNEPAERICLSSGSVGWIEIFDHPWADTKLCLKCSAKDSYQIQEYCYEDGRLKEMTLTHPKGRETYKYLYEEDALIQIERVCENGYRNLYYTTKKPDFNTIKEKTYLELKSVITENGKDFCSFGIEGFIDQFKPMISVCFTDKKEPEYLIADWNAEFYNIYLYDYLLNDSQFQKCICVVAEILAELVKEGLLKDKRIYFHQNQECVTEKYSRPRKIFEEAEIIVY